MAATTTATVASIEHGAAVNTYFLPRPSARGAILWQRRRSAWALTLSGGAVGITLLCLLLAVIAALAYPPFLAVALYYWAWWGAAVFLGHLLVGDLVRIRPQGVTAARLALSWRSLEPIPLAGEFRQTPSRFRGDPDRPHDPDPWQDELTQWIYYEHDDAVLAIDCLLPKATADWLNAQLSRIQAQQLPTARVVDGPRVKDEGGSAASNEQRPPP